jgi:hypothetical protein
MNPDDIKALKEELVKDLEALDRVEAMLRRKNGASPSRDPLANKVVAERVTEALLVGADRAPGVNTGLQELVLAIVKETRGQRASDVKNTLVKRGYKFRTPANAASSVFSALKRLVDSGRVSKRGMKYYAIEQPELLQSA